MQEPCWQTFCLPVVHIVVHAWVVYSDRVVNIAILKSTFLAWYWYWILQYFLPVLLTTLRQHIVVHAWRSVNIFRSLSSRKVGLENTSLVSLVSRQDGCRVVIGSSPSTEIRSLPLCITVIFELYSNRPIYM